MQITYISSFRDQWRCALYAVFHRSDVILKLILPVVLVTLQVSKHLSRSGLGNSEGQRILIAFVISATSYAIFIQFLLLLLIMIRVLSPASKRQCTSIISLEGFCDATQAKTKAVSWSQISQIRYHAGDIFFMQKGKDGNFVPKSAFADLVQAQAFFETAHGYWAAAKSGQTMALPHDETVWPPAPRAGNSAELDGKQGR